MIVAVSPHTQMALPIKVGKGKPVVSFVLVVGDRLHAYQAPVIERLAINYDTPQSVRVVRGVCVDLYPNRVVYNKAQFNADDTLVYCLPDDLAWLEVNHLHREFQVALDALAEQLRANGAYATRLEQSGGLKQAPNPLTPTVVQMEDPDDPRWGTQCMGWWGVPNAERSPIIKHSAVMMRVQHREHEQPCSQRGMFCCATDNDWQDLVCKRQHAIAAGEAIQTYLNQLGTYREARSDGRYSSSTGENIARSQSARSSSRQPRIENQPDCSNGQRQLTNGSQSAVSTVGTQVDQDEDLQPSLSLVSDGVDKKTQPIIFAVGDRVSPKWKAGQGREGEIINILTKGSKKNPQLFAEVKWLVGRKEDIGMTTTVRFDQLLKIEQFTPSEAAPQSTPPDELKPGDRVRITNVQIHQSKSWIGQTGTITKIGKVRIRVQVPGKGNRLIELPLPPDCIDKLTGIYESTNSDKVGELADFKSGDRVAVYQKGHPDLHGKIIELKSENEAAVYIDEFQYPTLVATQYLYKFFNPGDRVRLRADCAPYQGKNAPQHGQIYEAEKMVDRLLCSIWLMPREKYEALAGSDKAKALIEGRAYFTLAAKYLELVTEPSPADDNTLEPYPQADALDSLLQDLNEELQPIPPEPTKQISLKKNGWVQIQGGYSGLHSGKVAQVVKIEKRKGDDYRAVKVELEGAAIWFAEQYLRPIAKSEAEAILQTAQIESQSTPLPLEILPEPEELHELALPSLEIVPGNPEATIRAMLRQVGFVYDGYEPSDGVITYRDWQLGTDSPNGGMIAVSICPPGWEWWGMATEEAFGYYEYEKAIAWLKQLIDCLIDAENTASGQLNLLSEPSLELGDCVQVLADDDLYESIVVVAQSLPTGEVEIDYQGVLFSYPRSSLRLYEKATPESIQYLAAQHPEVFPVQPVSSGTLPWTIGDRIYHNSPENTGTISRVGMIAKLNQKSQDWITVDFDDGKTITLNLASESVSKIPANRRANLIRQINNIRQSGEVAPKGCWIERSPTTKKLANGERVRFLYYRVKAYQPIFQGEGGKMVKSLHLGTETDPYYQDWCERMERRRKINELEAELDKIERQG